MEYCFNQSQIHQMEAWLPDLQKYYSEDDASILKTIIQKAVTSKYLGESDIYKLLDVLPKIVSMLDEKSQIIKENFNTDWNEYIDEHRAKYKRETEKLYHLLSNWVFMQSAVYRRNMEPLTSLLDKAQHKSNNQGIKK